MVALLPAQEGMEDGAGLAAVEQLVSSRLKGVYFADLALKAAGQALISDSLQGNVLMGCNLQIHGPHRCTQHKALV